MKALVMVAALMFEGAEGVGQPSTAATADTRPYICSSTNFDTARLPRAKKNYLLTLGSDNDGVVESALALVTQMRIVLPQDDMREIELVVNQLALKGNTPVIRYKSYLAVQVFASPDLFRQVARTDFPSGDDFFASIASRLQQSMLGYTSK